MEFGVSHWRPSCRTTLLGLLRHTAADCPSEVQPPSGPTCDVSVSEVVKDNFEVMEPFCSPDAHSTMHCRADRLCSCAAGAEEGL